MSRTLALRNRQRARAVDLRCLRRVVKSLLCNLLQINRFDLGIYIVAAPEMTRLNGTFLQHQGSTDVITFDYAETPGQAPAAFLCAELFVCLDEALVQARRFRTTWQQELARYVVHGILHLRGYDDHQPRDRSRMKRAEDRLLRELGSRYNLAKLAAPNRRTS